MKIITVLTPTYNRRELIPVLFDSLCHQSDKDFEWLVIDDGSTDGTNALIESFRKKADFKIVYKWKENGGKHSALNYAYQFISTILTFIVDSDDRLTPDAISSVREKYEKFREERELCGFSFLKVNHCGEYLSTSKVPADGMKESFVECRINRRIGGDMAEAWYTKCLKEFPFPEIPGENFLGEDTVWIRMAEKYRMRFFNKAIYVAEYRGDGLTNNRRKHNIACPKGCVYRAETFLNSDACIRAKIKAMLQYQIYGRFAQITSRELFNRSKEKGMFMCLYIPSILIYFYWRTSL